MIWQQGTVWYLQDGEVMQFMFDLLATNPTPEEQETEVVPPDRYRVLMQKFRISEDVVLIYTATYTSAQTANDWANLEDFNYEINNG